MPRRHDTAAAPAGGAWPGHVHHVRQAVVQLAVAWQAQKCNWISIHAASRLAWPTEKRAKVARRHMLPC